MGCAKSKLDDLPAVALCRDRTQRLADAINHRYALADAHAAYTRSLCSVGSSLYRLIDGSAGGGGGASPVLPLPTQRKGHPIPPLTPSPPPTIPAATHVQGHSHSHSGSGSHIQFHSSDDDSNDDSPLHSAGSSPIHLHPEERNLGAPPYVNISYAKNHPVAPSVSYEQRPRSPETIHYGGSPPEPSSSSSPPGYSYSGYPYPNQNPNYYSYAYPYPYPSSYPGYGGGMGGFFGSSSPPPQAMPPPPAAGGSSPSSRAPPPPPSPPRASTWDFLNPFESYESYYQPYTPSRSSKEVREEEGIPDLEDEEHEVVKEAYGDNKYAASTSGAVPGEYPRKSAAKEDEIRSVGEEPPYKSRSVEARSSTEYEAVVVDKNVVAGDAEPSRPAEEERRSVAFTPRVYRDFAEVAGEIKTQFDRASETADEFSRMLEVGKLPYHQKNSVYQVSSRMISVIAVPSTPKEVFEFEEDKVMGSGNLSSTLQKLYMWEKKLYEEVRAEEKMRLLHDRKCKRLKHLDERGAEAYKVDATQTMIKKLSTKIRIAIQVVETISRKINKLRDEELWPQINELIQGFVKMWKIMSDCHRTQCQAISQAKNIDSVALGGKLTEAYMEVLLHLELELLEWIGNFTSWVAAQKNYVKALNGWLLLCLHYEPEETPDGIAPFSPGRIGAPPVFVICNYWSQAVDRISEREVIDAMHSFASSVRNLWQHCNSEERQKLMANRDMDKWLRTRERDSQVMNKAVDALNKKLDLVSSSSGQIGNPSDNAEVIGMQAGLKQVFEAMESFTACSLKAYEELYARSEEERLARENAKVS